LFPFGSRRTRAVTFSGPYNSNAASRGLSLAAALQKTILFFEGRKVYIVTMTTVQEIEIAVQGLPEKELNSFRTWFDECDSNASDKQFEQDAQSGKLDLLAGEAVIRQ
jgi:hypothetical protein